MAGETPSVPSAGRMPEIDVVDPFDKMNSKLVEIERALSGADDLIWDLTGGGTVIQSQHVRFRAKTLVFDVSAAATVTFTVGTRTRTFSAATALTFAVPLPVIIERGTDVSLTASAGIVTGYLIGTAE